MKRFLLFMLLSLGASLVTAAELEYAAPQIASHYAVQEALQFWAYQNASESLLELVNNSSVTAMAFNPKMNIIATGTAFGGLYLWNAQTGEQLYMFNEQDAVTALAFSPDGQWLASGHDETIVENQQIRIWNIRTGASEYRLQGPHHKISGLTFSRDGRYLISATAEGFIGIWDRASEKAMQIFKGHEAKINAIALSPDNRMFATASTDQKICLWDLSGNLLREFTGHVMAVIAIAFSPDGRFIISSSSDKRVVIWDIAAGTAVRILPHNDGVISLAIAQDGASIITLTRNGIIRVWDFDSGALAYALEVPDRSQAVTSFAVNGAFMITGTANGTIEMRDIKTGKQIRSLGGNGVAVTKIVVSPARDSIAFSFRDTVIIWKLYSWEVAQEIDNLPPGAKLDLYELYRAFLTDRIIQLSPQEHEFLNHLSRDLKRAINKFELVIPALSEN